MSAPYEVGEIVRFTEAHHSHHDLLKERVGEVGEIIRIMDLENGPKYLIDFGDGNFPRWWIAGSWLQPIDSP